MRWEAWPALLGTLAWASFMALFEITYQSGGQLGWFPPLILTGVPLAISARTLVRDWNAAEWNGWKPNTEVHPRRPWLVRLVSAVALGLVVLGSVYAMLTARSFSFDFGFDSGPVVPGRLLPGGSEIWAYGGSLLLTAVIVGHTWRGRLTGAAVLGVCAVIGGGLVVAGGSALGLGAFPGGCGDHIRVVIHAVDFLPAGTGTEYYSTASGDLDGAWLGFATVARYPGSPASVRYETRWGTGDHDLNGNEEAAFNELRQALSPDNLLTGDDLGIDSIGGRATRHCQMVIDGRSAVRSFFAMRWLTGADENTADAGAGLEAWRGSLDYWIVRAPQDPDSTPGDAGHEVVLAAVRVDGQPSGWPWPGLRAGLFASTYFGF